MNKVTARPEILFTLVLFIFLCLLGCNVNTTGDSGDSVLHFLYSKYAFKYPSFFFHHWAKPVFVLLSAPFAQFGFKGIIIFNCFIVSLSTFFTYKLAEVFKLRHPWLIFIIFLASPLHFKLIFSGLTEYLFAFVLILSTWLAAKDKLVSSALIISFLPLVRSEGLIILAVFGLFFLLQKKKFLLLPCLITGHLVYAIAGYFYSGNFLWVFTQIPYQNLGSPYGHGNFLDFVHRLNYVIEKPVYALLILGLVFLLISLYKTRAKQPSLVYTLLIATTFLLFFLAHMVFWWLGTFNSMGLPRVMISVIPAISLIALSGLNGIEDFFNNVLFKRILVGLTTILIIAFPFTYRKHGIVYNKNLFNIEENNLAREEVIPWLEKMNLNPRSRLAYYTFSFINIPLNTDYFDKQKHRDLNWLTVTPPEKGSVIIWDNYYSPTESGVSLEFLMNNRNLKFMKEFNRNDGDKLIKFAVFKAE